MRHDKRRGKYTPRSRQTATAARAAGPTRHLPVRHPQEVPQEGWVSGQSKMGRDPVRNPPPAPPESAAVRVEYTLVLTEEVAGTHGSELATVRPGRKQDLLQPQLGSSARASATVTVLHSLVSYGVEGGDEKGKEGGDNFKQ